MTSQKVAFIYYYIIFALSFIYLYYKTEPTIVLEHFVLDYLRLSLPIYVHASRDPPLM